VTTVLAHWLVASVLAATLPSGAQLRLGDLASDGWDAVDAVAVSGDGQFALVNGPKTMGLSYRLADGKLVHTLRGHSRDVRAVAGLPGARGVTASVDGSLRLWDLATGKMLRHFKGGHTDIVGAVAGNRNGTRILSGGSDRRLVLWETATGKRLKQYDLKHSVYALALSPDAKRVAVSDLYALRVLQLRDGKLLWRHSGLSCGHDRANPLSCVGGRMTREKEYPSKRGGRVVSRKVRRLNIYLGDVAWAPDGKSVAVARENGDVVVYDAATGKPSARFVTPASADSPATYEPLLGLAVSPDGSTLAAGSKKGKVYVWKLGAKQTPARTFEGHQKAVRALAFTPNGKHLLSGSTDSTVLMWQL